MTAIPDLKRLPLALATYLHFAPTGWPSLQWATLDPRGETAAYRYGFQ